MKRLCTVIVFLLLLTLHYHDVAFGQDLQGGVKIGMNYSKLSGYQYGEAKYKSGYVGGVFGACSLNDWIAFQIEMLYAQKGAEWEMIILGATSSGIIQKTMEDLEYLQFPVLAKLTLPTDFMIKPNLYLGPSFDVLLSAKVDMPLWGEVDEKEFTRNHDIGLIVGGGADIALNDYLNIVVDLRYTIGLIEINEPYPSDYMLSDKKNSALSILMGFGFH